MTLQWTVGVFMALACLSIVSGAQEVSKDPSAVAEWVSEKTPLRKGERIAFFGDSITMQGGYIEILRKAIQESPHTNALGVELFRHGLNGGRVPTVLKGESPWGKTGGTMQELLDTNRPTVVVIYLGINDVWHGDKGTTKDEFEAGLEKMLALTKQAGAAAILCTPSVIGEETENNKLNDKLGKYADVIRKLAKTEGHSLCDLHEAFLEKLKKVNDKQQHKGHLTYDGVHMNDHGNALIAEQLARTMMKALAARK